MTLVWLGLSALSALLIAITLFRKWRVRSLLLLGLIMTAGFFGAMLLTEYYFGNAGAWDIYALVFIGTLAAISQDVWLRAWLGREREVWEGHAHQDPETEHFSETLKLTVNNLTGACRGLVLAGPYRGRYLADLSPAEFDALAHQCADDPQGGALLQRFKAAQE